MTRRCLGFEGNICAVSLSHRFHTTKRCNTCKRDHDAIEQKKNRDARKASEPKPDPIVAFKPSNRHANNNVKPKWRSDIERNRWSVWAKEHEDFGRPKEAARLRRMVAELAKPAPVAVYPAREWTAEDDAQMISLREQGYKFPEMSPIVMRSHTACSARYQKLVRQGKLLKAKS